MADGVLTRIFQQVLNEISSVTNGQELEARFKPYSNYLPYLQQTYNRLVEYYGSKGIETTYSTYTVESMSKGPDDPITIRKIIKNNQTRWQKKTRLRDIVYKPYNLKFALSEEEELVSQEGQKFKPNNTRIIERYSFKLNRYAKLEISKVVNKGADNTYSEVVNKGVVDNAYSEVATNDNEENTNAITYDFELEMTGNNVSKFLNSLVEPFKLMHDTNIVYNKNTYSAQFTQVNKLLGYRTNNRLDKKLLFKARDLKYPDLVASVFLDRKTRVGFKTDGIRKCMIIDRTGVWLAFGNSLNLLQLQEKGSGMATTSIFDGELVPVIKRKNNSTTSTYYYVIFDVLMINNEDIRSKSHLQRMSSLKGIELIKNDLLSVDAKTFYDYNTADEFFTTMKILETKIKPKLPYEDDGYIFLSNNMPYNSGTDSKPPADRLLIRHPDVCKWKPIERLTIDVRAVPLKGAPNGRYALHVYDPNKEAEVPFEVMPPMALKGIKPNSIVELRYSPEKKKWYSIGARSDRASPNGINEARDVWKLIRNPIDIKTLTGQSLRLMRKYHNRVKADLYKTVSGHTALEIGIGKGGTKEYWGSFERIIGVEPNVENIIELSRRLNGELIVAFPESDIDTLVSLYRHFKYKVFVIVTGGEDYELITKVIRAIEGPKEKIDCVVSMFSLTFFWASKSMLRKLKKTIRNNLKSDGTLLFSVMDGTSVDSIFRPQAKEGPVQAPRKDKIKNELFTISYNGSDFGDPLEIFLKDTIVGAEGAEGTETPQVEFLAFVEQLFEDTFDTMWVRKFDQEQFMNEYERYLSSMYIYGAMNNLISKPQVFKDEGPALLAGDEEFEELLGEVQGVGAKKTPKIVLDTEVDFYEGPPPEEKVVEPIAKSENIQLNLPKLSKSVRKEQAMGEINVKDIIAPIARRVGHRTVPLIINHDEDKVVEEESYVRISSAFGLYGGFYQALLTSFFGPYSASGTEEREIYIQAMIDEYGDPNIVQISRDLNLSIIVISLSTEGQIFVVDYILRANSAGKTRPVIVVAAIEYDNATYYESIGIKEVLKVFKKEYNMYRTVFQQDENFIKDILLKPYNVLQNYSSSIMRVSNENRKFRVKEFETLTIKELESPIGTTIVDPTVYGTLQSKRRKLGKVIGEKQVRDIIKDSYPHRKSNIRKEILEILNVEELGVPSGKLLEIGNSKVYAEVNIKDARTYLISDDLDEDIRFEKKVKVVWKKDFEELYGDENIVSEKIKTVNLAILTLTGNYRSYVSQLILALLNLSEGGNMIMRLHDSDNDFIQSIIYTLTNVFDTVKLVKPSEALPYEPYRYLVALSLVKPDVLINIIKLFELVRSSVSKDFHGKIPQSIVPLAWISGDRSFIDSAVVASRKYDNSELNAIETILGQIVD